MPKDPKWGSHIHVTGYWYHPEEDSTGYHVDPALEQFLTEGEKPVFVAFGKAESPALAKLQMLTLEALKATGIKAVVHHGGCTTNGLGLWAGCPHRSGQWKV